LGAFFACDADTDVGALDHTYVVGAVADCQSYPFPILFGKFDDLHLLRGRNSAANAGIAQIPQLKKEVPGSHGVLHSPKQRHSVYHNPDLLTQLLLHIGQAVQGLAGDGLCARYILGVVGLELGEEF